MDGWIHPWDRPWHPLRIIAFSSRAFALLEIHLCPTYFFPNNQPPPPPRLYLRTLFWTVEARLLPKRIADLTRTTYKPLQPPNADCSSAPSVPTNASGTMRVVRYSKVQYNTPILGGLVD